MADLVNILTDQKEELESIDLAEQVSRQEEIQLNLKSKVAQVVIGVRRSGKSTICHRAIVKSGMPFGYVNFDDERLDGMTTKDFDKILKTLYRHPLYG